MRVAFVNSGLGLLAAAAELRRRHPGADVILSMDPDGMPWGPRTPQDITARTLACARAALDLRPDAPPDAVVVACNTATVHAIDALRAELEPRIPVVGTVPAIKPAAAAGAGVAVWATVATTGSAYQRRLVRRYGRDVPVALVACPGLADAVHAGDTVAIGREVDAARALTPAGTAHVVLGCTEYELAADLIAEALPGVTLHGTAPAVIRQLLRRVPDPDGGAAGGVRPEPSGRLDVLLSGRPGPLPAAALRYPAGRALLAAHPG